MCGFFDVVAFLSGDLRVIAAQNLLSRLGRDVPVHGAPRAALSQRPKQVLKLTKDRVEVRLLTVSIIVVAGTHASTHARAHMH